MEKLAPSAGGSQRTVSPAAPAAASGLRTVPPTGVHEPSPYCGAPPTPRTRTSYAVPAVRPVIVQERASLRSEPAQVPLPLVGLAQAFVPDRYSTSKEKLARARSVVSGSHATVSCVPLSRVTRTLSGRSGPCREPTQMVQSSPLRSTTSTRRSFARTRSPTVSMWPVYGLTPPAG